VDAENNTRAKQNFFFFYKMSIITIFVVVVTIVITTIHAYLFYLTFIHTTTYLAVETINKKRGIHDKHLNFNM
jgi:hypothetical protein